MELGDQVCSLELAKKLRGLGVKQESLFYWFDNKEYHYLFCKCYEQYSSPVNLDIKDGYSAFTVAELGEMLGCWVITGNHRKNDWWCRHHYMEYEHDTDGKIEANARAKMLIYLIENGLVENEI